MVHIVDTMFLSTENYINNFFKQCSAAQQKQNKIICKYLNHFFIIQNVVAEEVSSGHKFFGIFI